MPVHDVQVEPVGPALPDRGQLAFQIGQIRVQDGGGEQFGKGHFFSLSNPEK
jgi:hypothetical protein